MQPMVAVYRNVPVLPHGDTGHEQYVSQRMAINEPSIEQMMRHVTSEASNSPHLYSVDSVVEAHEICSGSGIPLSGKVYYCTVH